MLGSTVGARYRLDDELGRGGMGQVFRATDLRSGRTVAVKVLTDLDPTMAKRFAREANAMAHLRHRHVVEVLDAAPDASPPFYVMEVLEGRSLRAVAVEGAFAIDRAVRIARQLLSALEVAHATVVHRDIKPANVMLVHDRGEEIAKLLDFGIAKALDDDGVRTTTGTLLGTPAYMAPEQVLAKPVDARTDLHAVALVLFEMLTAKRVFLGRGAGDVAAKVVGEVPPDVRTLRADVPPFVAEAIARALAKDPAQRFPSARAMSDALAGTTAKKPSPLVLGSFVALGTVLAGGAIALAAITTTTTKPPPIASAFSSSAPSATGSEAPPVDPPEEPAAIATAGPTPTSRPAESTRVPSSSAPSSSAPRQSTLADAAEEATTPPRVSATRVSLVRTLAMSEDDQRQITSVLPGMEACLKAHPNELFAGDTLIFRPQPHGKFGDRTPCMLDVPGSAMSGPLWTCLDDQAKTVKLEAKLYFLKWSVDLR